MIYDKYLGNNRTLGFYDIKYWSNFYIVSYWLIAHVGFAKLAFGSILVAVGIAALYILKERHSRDINANSFYDRLPPLEIMDELMYRFVASGLLFLTIMVGAGAIWANQTWGRYWGWDPTETWSLITWFVYGICLHLRMNVGWTGKKVAWLRIAPNTFDLAKFKRNWYFYLHY